MLDNPEKTARLLAALKAAVPFEAELPERLVKHLQAQQDAVTDHKRHTVYNLSYAGDEGGIMCHMSRAEGTGRALVCLSDSCSGVSFDAACSSRCRLSEASTKEAKETESHILTSSAGGARHMPLPLIY